MPTATPSAPVSIVRANGGSRTNGVLPSPTTTDKFRTNNANGKSSAPRLKIVVRRLASGLTEEEFSVSLGDEWKIGRGKVDWISYRPGKVSKE